MLATRRFRARFEEPAFSRFYARRHNGLEGSDILTMCTQGVSARRSLRCLFAFYDMSRCLDSWELATHCISGRSMSNAVWRQQQYKDDEIRPHYFIRYGVRSWFTARRPCCPRL